VSARPLLCFPVCRLNWRRVPQSLRELTSKLLFFSFAFFEDFCTRSRAFQPQVAFTIVCPPFEATLPPSLPIAKFPPPNPRAIFPRRRLTMFRRSTILRPPPSLCGDDFHVSCLFWDMSPLESAVLCLGHYSFTVQVELDVSP